MGEANISPQQKQAFGNIGVLEYGRVSYRERLISNISVSKQELRIMQLLTENQGDCKDEIKALLQELPLEVVFNLRSITGYSILHLACSLETSDYALSIIQ